MDNTKLYNPAIVISYCPVFGVESVSNIFENVYRNEYYMYCTTVLPKHLIFAEFICNDNAQCNGHGDCDDGQCNCESDWNVKPDCSGNIHYNTVILGDTPISNIMSILGS